MVLHTRPMCVESLLHMQPICCMLYVLCNLMLLSEWLKLPIMYKNLVLSASIMQSCKHVPAHRQSDLLYGRLLHLSFLAYAVLIEDVCTLVYWGC